MSGDLFGQVFSLIAKPITIGRESDNLVCVNEETISKHHAVLIPEPDGYLLRDLDSTNGTLVNGHLIREHGLRNGDTVRVGSLEMRYELQVSHPVVQTAAEFTIEQQSAARAFPVADA
jgi:pSer/pThr/pTyr-binding forkhead associated (FHA) protein